MSTGSAIANYIICNPEVQKIDKRMDSRKLISFANNFMDQQIFLLQAIRRLGSDVDFLPDSVKMKILVSLRKSFVLMKLIVQYQRSGYAFQESLTRL
jgi:hypothetical protein